VSVEDDVFRSEHVARFVDVAERFCAEIESVERLPKVLFLQKMDELLPLLYYSACNLPGYPWDDEDDESEEGMRVYEERTKYVEDLRTSIARSRPVGIPVDERVDEKLKPHSRYSFVFDPVDQEKAEAIGGSIPLDIESIYSDVGEALDLYRTGDELAMRQAIWDWGFYRKCHWGFHLLNAMAAISSLLHRHYDEDDEVFDI
jgi:Domain of unknown function (DUF5063)